MIEKIYKNLNKLPRFYYILFYFVFFVNFSDGCRPFIEIYEGYNKVLTTEQEYERLPTYDISHGKVVYLYHIVL